MTTHHDIIEFAEQYRNFHFIPGNRYNPDVVEKVRLAEALLVAVDALAFYARQDGLFVRVQATSELHPPAEYPEAGLAAKTALSRIRSLPIR